MKETWAEREVRLACERENPNRKDGEFDYGCACYESALKAYKSLTEDGHSGFSIMLTKNILNRLIDHKPLTPIEDTNDIWGRIYISWHLGEIAKYQCIRMGSLFKYVYADGKVTYHDVDRVLKVVTDKDGNETCWHSGLTNNIIDELFPITMPYMPENEPYKVYCEDFLSDKANGDYDTVGVFYIIKPDGTRVDVNRYFGEIDGSFKEIDKETYLQRLERSKS